MITLTLDIGTLTGWALFSGDDVTSGTFRLATDEELQTQREKGEERTQDIRFKRFFAFLQTHLDAGVQRVVYEDVQFVSNQMQAQLWASLRAAIWALAQMYPIQIRCVPVQTLKKFATGTGHALKPEMAKALASKDSKYGLNPDGSLSKDGGISVDDNEVDALWLLHYTKAVDSGEKDFASPYLNKRREKALRVQKRALRRKAKRERLLLLKQERHEKTIAKAIRALGLCCGVPPIFVKGKKAQCPACHRLFVLDMPKLAKPVATPPTPLV